MALKKKITTKEIQQKIGDENIFNHYFGEFEIGKAYCSPLRDDKKVSCSFFEAEDGSLIFNDFGISTGYNSVSFVAALYGITYHQALDKIAVDFGLIKGSKDIPLAVIKPIKKRVKKEKVIRVGVVKFKKHHLDYWADYGITRKELEENNVYAVNSLYINDWQVETKEDDLRFAYLVKDEETGKQYLKVYSPHDPNYKWTSSVPLHLPFGLQELSLKTDTLFITKGQKDRIILKKYFPDVIATQNEGKAGLKPEMIKILKKLYKNIYIWYDTDRPGIKAVNYYKKLGFKPIILHDGNIWQRIAYAKQTGIKDLSDYVKNYGLGAFEQLLKKYKLWG